MREIKFRAWDKDKKVMDDMFSIYSDGRVGLFSSVTSSDDLELENLVVMQYTGLKDKNGKELFEGDIITFDGNMTADNTLGIEPNGYIFDETSIHSVSWNKEQACWDVTQDEDEEWKYKRDCHSLLLQGEYKIIGNIYQNSELLK